MNIDQKNIALTSFSPANKNSQNTFIRNSPDMLSGIFGTTEVTPFWVADMDFTIANPIKAELQRLVDRGQFAYEFNSKGVFNAIQGWYQRRHHLTLDSSNFTQVTGVLTGIALLIRELSSKGDGVLIQTPAYHQFSKVISTADRKVIKSALQIVDGQYQIDFVDLAAKLSAPDVKLMILCNPHNPMGRVWRVDELEKLLYLAKEYNVTIISDEIHADIIYAGHKFTSLMALDAGSHVALIGSPAKTFGMQSISNGYIYTENPEILSVIRTVTESMYLDHGNALTTFATIAAYEKGDKWVDELLEYLQNNLEWISTYLAKEIPNVTFYPVEGTYQVWLNFSATGLSGDSLIKAFATAGFGASPGTWFDPEAQQFARMNFAAPRDEIEKAFHRLKNVLDQTEQSNKQACEKAPVASKSCC